MKKLLLPLLIASSICLFYGCPDDSPVKPKPVDPCEYRQNTKAGIKKQIMLPDTVIETDTIIPNRPFYLSATGADYYEWDWKIGYDTSKRNTKNVMIYFTEDEGLIPITLIAKRPPSDICGDDGIDTVTTYVYVKYFMDIAIVGEYLGFDNIDTARKYHVKIFFYDKDHLDMFNVNYGCGDTLPLTMTDKYMSNSVIVFFSDEVGHGCKKPTGKAYLNTAQDSITIDYTYGEEEKHHAIFRGRRI